MLIARIMVRTQKEYLVSPPKLLVFSLFFVFLGNPSPSIIFSDPGGAFGSRTQSVSK